MPRRRTAVVLVALVSGAGAIGACGTRTSLLIPDPYLDGPDASAAALGEPPPDASVSADAADADAGTPATGDGGIHCSIFTGPVASCDAGPAAGPVEICKGAFSECIKIFRPGDELPSGQWGCCLKDPPEGVNQCLDPEHPDSGC